MEPVGQPRDLADMGFVQASVVESVKMRAARSASGCHMAVILLIITVVWAASLAIVVVAIELDGVSCLATADGTLPDDGGEPCGPTG